MASVPRLWPGATIACLATGPSLNQSDCDYLRGKVRVVAINDAYRLAPWADVLYSSDRRWWNVHYRAAQSFRGMKYGIGSGTGKQNGYVKCPDVVVLKNTGYDGLDKNPNSLRTGRNSGFAALNLAVHLGAARILLLGYNMSYQGRKAHFFGDHPPGLPQMPGLYPGFRRSFDRVAAEFAELGIEVINCTENTSLTAFPLQPLREVLEETAVAA